MVEFDAGMQRTGEWRVFHDWDRMLAAKLSDLQGHRIDTHGNANGRIHAAFIMQSDGIMGLTQEPPFTSTQGRLCRVYG